MKVYVTVHLWRHLMGSRLDRRSARQGDGALVLEAESTTCALRVDQVDHVASLLETDGAVVDASGRPLTLLDPVRMVRRALELIGQGAAS